MGTLILFAFITQHKSNFYRFCIPQDKHPPHKTVLGFSVQTITQCLCVLHSLSYSTSAGLNYCVAPRVYLILTTQEANDLTQGSLILVHQCFPVSDLYSDDNPADLIIESKRRGNTALCASTMIPSV